jgi:exodeoxyribonuclease V gamma subunit
MLSAQQRLYISYCGRSIKDNTLRNPSVLVSELLDYVEQGYVLECDSSLPLEQSGANLLRHLVNYQPLTPFSREYFDPDSRLFTYQHDWRAALNRGGAAQCFLSEPLADNLTDDLTLATIELRQLIRFFKQPSQYFLNQRLGVYFDDSTSDLAINEPFHPDALEGYQIKSSLLENFLNDSEQAASARIRAQGVLPHGHFSQLYLGQQTDLMAGLATVVKPYLAQPEPDVEIDLVIDDVTIQGWLKQHVELGLIRYKSGKANIKFFIHCYIEHLCYCTSLEAAAKPMIICCQDGQWRFDALPSSLAQEHLTKLVAYFRLGQTQPLAFFINSGWAYLTTLFDPKNLQLASDDKSLAKANKKFEQGFNGNYMFSGEGSDSYIERCFGQLNPQLQQQAIVLAIDILLPLRQQLVELSND